MWTACFGYGAPFEGAQADCDRFGNAIEDNRQDQGSYQIRFMDRLDGLSLARFSSRDQHIADEEREGAREESHGGKAGASGEAQGVEDELKRDGGNQHTATECADAGSDYVEAAGA